VQHSVTKFVSMILANSVTHKAADEFKPLLNKLDSVQNREVGLK